MAACIMLLLGVGLGREMSRASAINREIDRKGGKTGIQIIEKTQFGKKLQSDLVDRSTDLPPEN